MRKITMMHKVLVIPVLNVLSLNNFLPLASSFQLSQPIQPLPFSTSSHTFAAHSISPQLAKRLQQSKASQLSLNSSISSSSNSGEENLSPRQLVQSGMNAFINGDIDSSIKYFDRADRSVPNGSLKPYLWQRGISYYYADRFQDGSDQVSMRLCALLRWGGFPFIVIFLSWGFNMFRETWFVVT